MKRLLRRLFVRSQVRRPHPARRVRGIESLESRNLMTANIYLDFGTAFDLDTAAGEYRFVVDDAKLQGVFTDDVTGDVDTAVAPDRVKSVLDSLQDRSIDYTQDGFIDYLDVQVLSHDVANLVRRVFEPFDVAVHITASSDMDDVLDVLEGGSTNDAYILVAGGDKADAFGALGMAPLDKGNPEDSMAFAFADDLMQAVGNDWTKIAYVLANIAAHEAAHTFGLNHLDFHGPGPAATLTDDEKQFISGDVMNEGSQDHDGDGIRDRFSELMIASRWDMPQGHGEQNAFEVLSDSLGLKSGAPAFVTGSGAHDQITITGLANGRATVEVRAFRDPGYAAGDLIESQTYEVGTANGILVEGGIGEDEIRVVNVASRVTLRGGSGDDDLRGSTASDVLEGDAGDDLLNGGAQSDTYFFQGPRGQDYGLDTIQDDNGKGDKLDFSLLPFGVAIDLARTTDQTIERAPTTTIVIGGVSYEVTTSLMLANFVPRLDLRLMNNPIENVIGSEFNDNLKGNDSPNTFWGRGGKDTLEGLGGKDILWGGNGDDVLRGGKHDDQLFGEDGADQLFGDADNDFLNGGIDGDKDRLTGGDGVNTFVQSYRLKYINGYFAWLAEENEESLLDFDPALDKIERSLL